MGRRRKQPPTSRVWGETWRQAEEMSQRFLASHDRMRKKGWQQVETRLGELQVEYDDAVAKTLHDLQYEYSASKGALSKADIWDEHKKAVDLSLAWNEFKELSEPPVALLIEDGRKGIALIAKDQTRDGIGQYLRQAVKLWNSKITDFVRGKVSGGKQHEEIERPPKKIPPKQRR
jgi:hypothetical protein